MALTSRAMQNALVSAFKNLAGGLVAGYLVQWVYAFGLGYSPTLDLTGYASSISPYIGLSALFAMNVVAAMWLADKLPGGPLTDTLIWFGLIVMQLDDFIVLAHRIAAPWGGDPLVGGIPTGSGLFGTSLGQAEGSVNVSQAMVNSMGSMRFGGGLVAAGQAPAPQGASPAPSAGSPPAADLNAQIQGAKARVDALRAEVQAMPAGAAKKAKRAELQAAMTSLEALRARR